jgi:hypothetical protein
MLARNTLHSWNGRTIVKFRLALALCETFSPLIRQENFSVDQNVTARTPIFCVVFEEGSLWQVQAEWPDGTTEQVYKFDAAREALDWVKTQASKWVAERVSFARPTAM